MGGRNRAMLEGSPAGNWDWVAMVCYIKKDGNDEVPRFNLYPDERLSGALSAASLRGSVQQNNIHVSGDGSVLESSDCQHMRLELRR
jgi:hypothetical protein